MDGRDDPSPRHPADPCARVGIRPYEHWRGSLMAMLGWVMMGLAIWHFTIFLPDRFWGGIVGAFLGALVGAIVTGLLIYGLKVSALRVPGQHATDVAVVLYAVPGALIGIGLIYLEGIRRERRTAV